MVKNSLMKFYKIIITIVSLIFILDLINISKIIHIPFNNINLSLWSILVIFILYIFTYEIVDKKNNKRRENQESIAKLLLENTYKECDSYRDLLNSEMFKKICPKRFPGDKTMEDNSAYYNLKDAPFAHDSIIFSLGETGVISAFNISNYLIVKNKYSIYLTNVITFPDRDDITNPQRIELDNAIDNAIKALRK